MGACRGCGIKEWGDDQSLLDEDRGSRGNADASGGDSETQGIKDPVRLRRAVIDERQRLKDAKRVKWTTKKKIQAGRHIM